MLTIDNIQFKGNYRYMGATIHSLQQVPLFEVGKDKVSQELVSFSKESAFLNALKKDRDVFLHHHKEIFTDKEEPKTTRKSWLARLFSPKISKNNPRIGKEHLTVVFENGKADNTCDTELCEINISLPLNKGTPNNLNRFERILENNSDIDFLRKEADKLFPKNSHKLTLLPYNSEHGWCEFWTGEKSSTDTLNRLHIVFLNQITEISEKTLHNLLG